VGNTAVGRGALSNNATGNSNTAVGEFALLSTTSFSNTAIGNYALIHNTTGADNSALGSGAGRYLSDGTTNNETSTDSIFIGAGTRASSAGNINQIVIGTDAIGNGSNTVTLGNNSIVTTFLKGNVNIPQDKNLDFGLGGDAFINYDPDDLLTMTNTAGQIIINAASGLINKTSFTTKAATTASVATQIPVFTANPASTEQTIVTRTPAQLRSDMGLGNTTGALPVANGGTGATTLASGVLLGNGTSAITSRTLTDNASSPTSLSTSSTNILTEQTIAKGLVNVNGSAQSAITTIFAPTVAGTTGQYLKSNGSGAPSWSDISGE
jgi:hypothetical protein